MEPRNRSDISRRVFLAGSGAGAFGVAMGVLSGAGAANAADNVPPNYTKVPKLPNEISRGATTYTKQGNAYEIIDVLISGDRTRLFVPHASPPSKTAWVPVVWYYHANGSSYSSLTTAFNSAAEPTVDYGAISVCPNNGGSSAWVSPAAVTAHRNAVAYVLSLWRPFYNFQRANSGGGALMCWAYGNQIMPRMSGMYLASGVYDTWEIHTRAPDKIDPGYNYDAAAIAATNPAALPQSAWAGTRIRASYNPQDTVVPPAQHAEALLTLAGPVAVETSSFIHDGGGNAGGHVVPSSVAYDMNATFKRWANV